MTEIVSKKELLKQLKATPNKWHKLTTENNDAFDELQEEFGHNAMEFDGFTNQVRYCPLTADRKMGELIRLGYIESNMVATDKKGFTFMSADGLPNVLFYENQENDFWGVYEQKVTSNS